MPPCNETLAYWYSRNHRQVIVVFPLVWWHGPGTDWELIEVLPPEAE